MVKRGKAKRAFYGCSNYPECKFAIWDKPVARPCPACGAAFLVEKNQKSGPRMLVCRNEACDFKEEIAEVEDKAS